MPEKTPDNANRIARDQYQKALSAFERNNLDYAVEMFQQCLAIEPNFILARKYLRAAQTKRVESQGKLAHAMASAKLQPLLLKARTVLTKKPTEAMDLAEQALARDPRNGQALLLLAEAAENANFPETTVQTLDYYTKLNPRDTKAANWLARTHTTLNHHDQAREIYERLLQANPNDFDAQKGLKDATAQGAMKGGGWENQGTDFRSKLKDEKEAVTLEQQSRVIRAEDMIENLINEALAKHQTEPDNPVHRRELGKLYGQKGDYDRALHYLEALFHSEAGADPTLEKEISEVHHKRISDKITTIKQQLQTNPGNTTLQTELATLELQLDKLQLKDALRLVEKYPNDLMYRYDLGVLYMKTGDVQNAVEQFQKSIGQPQRRVASLNYLGQCFQQLGLPDLAVDQYTKAIEELPMMDGTKKEITYNLGLAYEALGQTDNAIAEYKKIAAVDFGYRDVRSKIARRPAS